MTPKTFYVVNGVVYTSRQGALQAKA